MRSLFAGFGETAHGLSRNPLGIIALFIVLVYGIAGLVLGFSAGNLNSGEKLPLIYFLVVFPVIVLASFLWLVAYHHTKLYAPHDFADKEGFFRALTPAERKEQLDTEVRDAVSEAAEAVSDADTEVEAKDTNITQGIGVRHASVLAEELALREIESEFGTTIHRQVAFRGGYHADGVLGYKGRLIAVEVKYTRTVLVKHRVAREIQRMCEDHRRMGTDVSFILAIVTDGLTEKRRRSVVQLLEKLMDSTPILIELRVYDFSELKAKYGIAGEET